MSGSESLDPKEPGDPSPHELGEYIVLCMYMYNTYINYRTLIIASILICMNTASVTLSNSKSMKSN